MLQKLLDETGVGLGGLRMNDGGEATPGLRGGEEGGGEEGGAAAQVGVQLKQCVGFPSIRKSCGQRSPWGSEQT